MFAPARSPLHRPANRRSPIIERFWAKIEREGSCWAWTHGHVGPNGYGMFSEDRKVIYAHRWSYQHFIGPIPDGLHIDHTCQNRACVNPNHLDAVTQAENNRRMWAHRRATSNTRWRSRPTHCKRGHEFTYENTYVSPNGWHYCRTCRRMREAEGLS